MNECFLDPLMCAERLAERAVGGYAEREREIEEEGWIESVEAFLPRSLCRPRWGGHAVFANANAAAASGVDDHDVCELS